MEKTMNTFRKGTVLNVTTSTPAEHRSLRHLAALGSKPAADVLPDFSFRVRDAARFEQLLGMHVVERVTAGGAQ
jgi:hypothetical protein